MKDEVMVWVPDDGEKKSWHERMAPPFFLAVGFFLLSLSANLVRVEPNVSLLLALFGFGSLRMWHSSETIRRLEADQRYMSTLIMLAEIRQTGKATNAGQSAIEVP